MPHMSEPELHAYLAEPNHLMRLGTIDGRGYPYVVPIWFALDGNRLLVSPREKSAWLQHIIDDPRVCASIDEQVLPHRKVMVQAEAEVVYGPGRDAEWLDTYRTIVRRYWEPVAAEDYIESTKHLSRALVSIPFEFGAAGVTNWRSITPGEDYSGIWAKRYWEPHIAGREAGTGPTGKEAVHTGQLGA
jgi:nitroimidazol reductase NimA-like FMN-containing flavoprotein (pyridoxamine 5'-phosphate oxidase superfamily)